MRGAQGITLILIVGIVVMLSVTVVMLSVIGARLDTIAKEQHKQTLIACINLRENGADSIGKIDREACGD